MDLTREQIERARAQLLQRSAQVWHEGINALCDMALRASADGERVVEETLKKLAPWLKHDKATTCSGYTYRDCIAGCSCGLDAAIRELKGG